MPLKALVAFGVAFGLLTLSLPAWSSGTNDPANATEGPAETAPTTIQKRSSGAAAASPVLTIEEALTRALEKSPKLSAFSREVTAREFEAIQAGLRPNPELSVEVENFAGSGEFSGADSAESTARLSQLLELGDKRERRQEVGRLEKEVAEREYRIARAEVLARTRERFIAVLAARKRAALAAEQVDLTRRVLETVKNRIEAGKAADIEQVRFGTLVAEARLRRQQALQELAAARNALATIWGSETADFPAVQGSLEEVHGSPEWSELTAKIDQSPATALQRSSLRRADRVLALERANRIPDLTVSLGVKNDRESGDNALVAEFAIPLPVFDRNQGAVAAARVRKARAADEAKATQLELQAELTDAWRRVREAYTEVEMLREEIIPATRKSFDGVVYGYRAGKFGFLDVLDAEQSLFEAKSRYVDALSAYHQAVSETERLLGQRIFTDGDLLPPAEFKRGQS